MTITVAAVGCAPRLPAACRVWGISVSVLGGAVPGRLPGRFAARWVSLFVLTRLMATGIAVALLLAHGGNGWDRGLAALTLVYGVGTVVLAQYRAARESPVAWAVDIGASLGLILATGDWRTPCYLLFVSSLVLPATSLRLGPALMVGAAAALGYLGVAALAGIDISQLENTPRLESLVTHLVVPPLVTFALAYGSEILTRLHDEHLRAERLAIESERQRIAWELHDSARQRTQVAHLLLSSLPDRLDDPATRDVVEQAMTEMRHADLDMQTSLEDPKAFNLDGRPLGAALRERARELSTAGRGRIEVHGEADALPPAIAAQAFRIANEALANAVRHAHARHIVAEIRKPPDGLVVAVSDDGRGMPTTVRAAASGLRSMRHRAAAIGADLRIAPVDDRGRNGTVVRLEVPLTTSPEVKP